MCFWVSIGSTRMRSCPRSLLEAERLTRYMKISQLGTFGVSFEAALDETRSFGEQTAEPISQKTKLSELTCLFHWVTLPFIYQVPSINCMISS